MKARRQRDDPSQYDEYADRETLKQGGIECACKVMEPAHDEQMMFGHDCMCRMMSGLKIGKDGKGYRTWQPIKGVINVEVGSQDSMMQWW